MKQIVEEQNDTKEIDAIISGIDSGLKNKRDPIIINETKNELLGVDRMINIPRIHVSKINYNIISDVFRQLAEIIPEYFGGHSLLPQQKPQSETHYIHLVKKVSGIHRDFIHMFKLDFRFSSDMGTNYHDGTADFYPSYSTERIPFKSLLIPVDSIKYDNNRIVDFSATRILRRELVDGDKHFMTHTIFDEFDPTIINEKIHDEAGRELFPFSLRIYPFIGYGYFSVCMNIPNPVPKEIEESVKMFEPIAHKIIGIFDADEYKKIPVDLYNDLIAGENGVQYTSEFITRVQEYFKRFKIFQDDELALKRWRRLDIVE